MKLDEIYKMKLTVRWAITLTGITLVGITVTAPTIQHLLGYPMGESLYDLVDPICHQYPSRSLWLFGRPLALCSRCTMGYAGLSFVIPLSFVCSLNRKHWYLIGLTGFLVSIFEPVLAGLPLYESSNLTRTLFGFIGGFSLSSLTIAITS
jgi:uncharacterized membrane protein